MNDMDLMQFYLSDLKVYFDSNPNLYQNSNFAYSKLETFNIPRDKYPLYEVQNLFLNCEKYFDGKQNIRTYFTPDRNCFLWFINGKIRGNEIKMYIPMDHEHILEGSKQLFDFMASTNMEHQSKISRMIRTDVLVIRVNRIEDMKKIIRFVENNRYIKEGMLKVNPFLPNYNGIGFAMDDNKSYNITVATLITEYYRILKQKNKEYLFTVDGLHEYIKGKLNIEQDLELKDIYKLLIKKTSKDFSINDFYSHVIYKQADKLDNNRKRIINPEFYLENAVKLTVAKHPENLPSAILHYLKGNSNYFTNDSNARLGLEKYVQPRDLINIMRTKLNKSMIPYPNNDTELVNTYVKIVCNTENKKEEPNEATYFEIIKQAYLTTRDTYGIIQADTAFKNLFLNNEVNLFTNQNGGYRRKLKEKLEQEYNVKQIILSNIDTNGLNVNNLKDVLDRFYLEVNKENDIQKSSAI